MASLRTVEWALVFAWGLVLLEAGCATPQPNGLSLPAEAVLASPPGEYPAALAGTASLQSPPLTPEELDQLVAPIALYPDALVAQVLAASTYPTEIVEAQRWIEEHAAMKGETLGHSIDQQPWDPSVKAVTQFPLVLAMMDENLSWTSALGEAYVHEPQAVMDAVQVLRSRAQQAGNLKSTPQQTVTADAGTIAIEPVDPEVVYVPEYDPWVIYGAPLAFYPGWIDVPSVSYGGPGVYFGLGIGIGLFGGFAWGWHHWDPDWHHHDVMFDHHPFVSHSPSYFNHDWRFDGHGHSYRGPAASGHPDFGRHSGSHSDFAPTSAGHPFTPASPAPHTGAFGGFDHGGVVGAYSARGRASVGGSFHSGGFAGGFHGAGFARGGFHR